LARAATSLVNKFIGHLNYLEKTRSKMEYLFSRNHIVRRDIEQVYAGLYMEAITSLETFIENLFLGFLVGQLIHKSNEVVHRVSFKSYLIARKVVYGGNQYVDWFPYYRTEKRAAAFFRNGYPFTYLDNMDKQQIEKILYIRNAIAHKSNYSLNKFEKEIIGSSILMPRERTPSGYLRSVFRTAPNQTRYEELIIEMSIISRKLC